jgi:rare lipoprotein A
MTKFRRSHVSLVVLLAGLLAGCSRHKQARVEVPAPPAVEPQPPVASVPEKSPGTTKAPVSPTTKTPAAESDSEETTLSVPADAVPILTETGLASWYGAPYHNRRSSNGELYNMHAMTAAHRTLPLGSIVRVTNVKTGQSALVKLEVMLTPTAIATGGRWAVQIGSFGNQKEASELADHLSRRYQTAKVAKFLSPVGDWWVRVRVLNDDRQRAESLAHETETREGSVYLVRLD